MKWLSWVCKEDDYRPISFPPNESILGWWCSGYDGDDNAIICALVKCEDEESAAAAIQKDWPEFDGNWRFISDFESNTLSDRFRASDWSAERLTKNGIKFTPAQ
jgi:hypothetical protein